MSFNAVWSNRSSPGLDLTRAVPVTLVLGSVILFAVVGNVLVILSVVCNRHLRVPTNYFIINLAIADLLLSTTVLPVSATLEVLGHWVFGKVFCDVWAAVDVLCCTASIMSLCVISIDRYIGVRCPLRYPVMVTERRALLAMLGVWVLAIVVSIGPLLGWKQPRSQDDTTCPITEEPFYALFSSLASFYIPLAVILAMYCRVYVVARRTTRNLEAGMMRERLENAGELTLRIHCKHPLYGAPGGQRGGALMVKLLKFSREKKAAKTLGVVVGMFILCWLPFFLVLPIGSFNADLRPPETFFRVTFWLGYFNSCLNPIIYPCYSREFKQAFIRILRCQWKRKRTGWQADYNYRCRYDSSSLLTGSQLTLSSSTLPSSTPSSATLSSATLSSSTLSSSTPSSSTPSSATPSYVTLSSATPSSSTLSSSTPSSSTPSSATPSYVTLSSATPSSSTLSSAPPPPHCTASWAVGGGSGRGRVCPVSPLAREVLTDREVERQDARTRVSGVTDREGGGG